jgi:amino acid transporter
MVNLLLVNPMTNITMVAVWAGAGFVGGVMAGTKKGAFVVGFITWLSAIGVLVFCVYLIFTTGSGLTDLVGALSTPPPAGTSLADLLGIPLFQDLLTQLLSILGGGGFSPDFVAILTPFLIWLFVPVIVVIVAGIVGATVRPKEAF